MRKSFYKYLRKIYYMVHAKEFVHSFGHSSESTKEENECDLKSKCFDHSGIIEKIESARSGMTLIMTMIGFVIALVGYQTLRLDKMNDKIDKLTEVVIKIDSKSSIYDKLVEQRIEKK